MPVVQFSNSAVNAANTSEKYVRSTGLHLSYHLSQNLYFEAAITKSDMFR